MSKTCYCILISYKYKKLSLKTKKCSINKFLYKEKSISYIFKYKIKVTNTRELKVEKKSVYNWNNFLRVKSKY